MIRKNNMSTHRAKRDRKNRAFDHGFRAGMEGRSVDVCPYDSLLELRGLWMGGWREGRDTQLNGVYDLQHG